MEQIGEGRASPLRLSIVTPSGIPADISCDSVVLPVADDPDGTPGGTVGIRHGHMPALFVLSSGTVVARLEGRTVLRATVAAGLAAVRDNVVRVLADEASVEK